MKQKKYLYFCKGRSSGEGGGGKEADLEQIHNFYQKLLWRQGHLLSCQVTAKNINEPMGDKPNINSLCVHFSVSQEDNKMDIDPSHFRIKRYCSKSKPLNTALPMNWRLYLAVQLCTICYSVSSLTQLCEE